PNDHWHNPTSGKADLAEALYYLAHTQRETGDLATGRLVIRERVRLFERLTEIHPGLWLAALEQAKTDATAFGA
ncbi:hypothetical protein, partial [Streptomyces erythrochromogenes]